MSRSAMVATAKKALFRKGTLRITGLCLALSIVVPGAVTVPSASALVPPLAPGAQPSLCRPEPPDYPGCSPEQVRPLLRARFANEYRGHASGYRYYRMGQHHRGVILAHLRPSLNAKLARLYRVAARQYAAAHTVTFIDEEGHEHVVVSYPEFRTWAGFKSQTTSFCDADNVTVHFPAQYCWSVTEIGRAGAVVRSLLYHTIKILFSCNGFAIGGWATGSYAAWKMGTGVLAGGYYGAAGVEIGCQTTNLWNWATTLW